MSNIIRMLRQLPIYVASSKTEKWSTNAAGYFPVKDTGTRNDTFDANAAIPVTQITDITGKVSYTDYIPVMDATGESVPISVDANGYIPLRLASGSIFTDPHFANVTLLANFETAGTGNQTDQSSYARVISRTGAGASVSASSPLWGSGSINVNINDATSLYTCADATALRLGASDFTLEAVCRWRAVNATNFSPTFVGKRGASTNIEFYWSYFNGNLYFGYSTDGTTIVTRTVAWTPSPNTTYNLSVTRSGSDLRFFVNGTQVGTTQTISGTIAAGTATAMRSSSA